MNIKILSLTICFAFMLEQVALTAPVISSPTIPKDRLSTQALARAPHTIDIPHESVTLKEVYQGSSDKLIIHIQDAHANYSGQQNLSKTLDHLMERYSIDTVLVEGSSLDASLNEVRGVLPPRDLKNAAKKLLFYGIISGEEYLNLTSDHSMKILGIENQELYNQNLDAYRNLIKKRDKILIYLRVIGTSIDRIKNKLYPKEILEYEQNLHSMNNAENDVTVKLRQLFKLAEGSEIFGKLGTVPIRGQPPISQKFPALSQLRQLQSLEASIDFDQANREQARLFDVLSELGYSNIFKYYVDRSKQMQTSPTAQYNLIHSVINMAAKANVSLERVPEFRKYYDYLKTFNELRLHEVLSEQIELEEVVYEHHLEDRDARIVRAIDRFIQLLDKAYRIQMTSTEYELYQSNVNDFPTASYQAFLNHQLIELGYLEDLIPFKEIVDEAQSGLSDFYSIVNNRDYAFIHNASRITESHSINSAFLIAGGYHTEHLTQLLREKNVSYVVLTPIVTNETDHEQYEKLLLANFQNNEDNSQHRYPVLDAVRQDAAITSAGSRLSTIKHGISEDAQVVVKAIVKLGYQKMSDYQNEEPGIQAARLSYDSYAQKRELLEKLKEVHNLVKRGEFKPNQIFDIGEVVDVFVGPSNGKFKKGFPLMYGDETVEEGITPGVGIDNESIHLSIHVKEDGLLMYDFHYKKEKGRKTKKDEEDGHAYMFYEYDKKKESGILYNHKDYLTHLLNDKYYPAIKDGKYKEGDTIDIGEVGDVFIGLSYGAFARGFPLMYGDETVDEGITPGVGIDNESIHLSIHVKEDGLLMYDFYYKKEEGKKTKKDTSDGHAYMFYEYDKKKESGILYNHKDYLTHLLNDKYYPAIKDGKYKEGDTIDIGEVGDVFIGLGSGEFRTGFPLLFGDDPVPENTMTGIGVDNQSIHLSIHIAEDGLLMFDFGYKKKEGKKRQDGKTEGHTYMFYEYDKDKESGVLYNHKDYLIHLLDDRYYPAIKNGEYKNGDVIDIGEVGGELIVLMNGVFKEGFPLLYGDEPVKAQTATNAGQFNESIHLSIHVKDDGLLMYDFQYKKDETKISKRKNKLDGHAYMFYEYDKNEESGVLYNHKDYLRHLLNDKYYPAIQDRAYKQGEVIHIGEVGDVFIDLHNGVFRSDFPLLGSSDPVEQGLTPGVGRNNSSVSLSLRLNKDNNLEYIFHFVKLNGKTGYAVMEWDPAKSTLTKKEVVQISNIEKRIKNDSSQAEKSRGFDPDDLTEAQRLFFRMFTEGWDAVAFDYMMQFYNLAPFWRHLELNAKQAEYFAAHNEQSILEEPALYLGAGTDIGHRAWLHLKDPVYNKLGLSFPSNSVSVDLSKNMLDESEYKFNNDNVPDEERPEHVHGNMLELSNLKELDGRTFKRIEHASLTLVPRNLRPQAIHESLKFLDEDGYIIVSTLHESIPPKFDESMKQLGAEPVFSEAQDLSLSNDQIQNLTLLLGSDATQRIRNKISPGGEYQIYKKTGPTPKQLPDNLDFPLPRKRRSSTERTATASTDRSPPIVLTEEHANQASTYFDIASPGEVIEQELEEEEKKREKIIYDARTQSLQAAAKSTVIKILSNPDTSSLEILRNNFLNAENYGLTSIPSRIELDSKFVRNRIEIHRARIKDRGAYTFVELHPEDAQQIKDKVLDFIEALYKARQEAPDMDLNKSNQVVKDLPNPFTDGARVEQPLMDDEPMVQYVRDINSKMLPILHKLASQDMLGSDTLRASYEKGETNFLQSLIGISKNTDTFYETLNRLRDEDSLGLDALRDGFIKTSSGFVNAVTFIFENPETFSVLMGNDSLGLQMMREIFQKSPYLLLEIMKSVSKDVDGFLSAYGELQSDEYLGLSTLKTALETRPNYVIKSIMSISKRLQDYLNVYTHLKKENYDLREVFIQNTSLFVSSLETVMDNQTTFDELMDGKYFGKSVLRNAFKNDTHWFSRMIKEISKHKIGFKKFFEEARKTDSIGVMALREAAKNNTKSFVLSLISLIKNPDAHVQTLNTLKKSDLLGYQTLRSLYKKSPQVFAKSIQKISENLEGFERVYQLLNTKISHSFLRQSFLDQAQDMVFSIMKMADSGDLNPDYISPDGWILIDLFLQNSDKKLVFDVYEVASLNAAMGIKELLQIEGKHVHLQFSLEVTEEMAQSRCSDCVIEPKGDPKNDEVRLIFHDTQHAQISAKDGSIMLPYDPIKLNLSPPDTTIDKQALRQTMSLPDDRKVIVVSSPSVSEVVTVLQAYSHYPDDERPLLVLGMREPKPDLLRIIHKAGFKKVKERNPQDQASEHTSFEGLAQDADIVMLNTRGELSSLFSVADIAIVGEDRNLFEPVLHKHLVILYFSGLWQHNQTSKTLLDEYEGALEIENIRLFDQLQEAMSSKKTSLLDGADKAWRHLREKTLPSVGLYTSILIGSLLTPTEAARVEQPISDDEPMVKAVREISPNLVPRLHQLVDEGLMTAEILRKSYQKNKFRFQKAISLIHQKWEIFSQTFDKLKSDDSIGLEALQDAFVVGPDDMQQLLEYISEYESAFNILIHEESVGMDLVRDKFRKNPTMIYSVLKELVPFQDEFSKSFERLKQGDLLGVDVLKESFSLHPKTFVTALIQAAGEIEKISQSMIYLKTQGYEVSEVFIEKPKTLVTAMEIVSKHKSTLTRLSDEGSLGLEVLKEGFKAEIYYFGQIVQDAGENPKEYFEVFDSLASSDSIGIEQLREAFSKKIAKFSSSFRTAIEHSTEFTTTLEKLIKPEHMGQKLWMNLYVLDPELFAKIVLSISEDDENFLRIYLMLKQRVKASILEESFSLFTERFTHSLMLAAELGLSDMRHVLYDGNFDLNQVLESRGKKLAFKAYEVASLNAIQGLMDLYEISEDNVVIYYEQEVNEAMVRERCSTCEIKPISLPYVKDANEVFLSFNDDPKTSKHTLEEDLKLPYDPFKYNLPDPLSDDEVDELKKNMGLENSDRKVIVVSSPRKWEYERVLDAYNAFPKNERPLLILGIREQNDNYTKDIKKLGDYRVKERNPEDKEKESVEFQDLAKDADVVILNTQGEFWKLTATADVAIVGHDRNLFEPVSQKKPVVLYFSGLWRLNKTPHRLLEKFEGAAQVNPEVFYTQLLIAMSPYKENLLKGAEQAMEQFKSKSLPAAGLFAGVALSALINYEGARLVEDKRFLPKNVILPQLVETADDLKGASESFKVNDETLLDIAAAKIEYPVVLKAPTSLEAQATSRAVVFQIQSSGSRIAQVNFSGLGITDSFELDLMRTDSRNSVISRPIVDPRNNTAAIDRMQLRIQSLIRRGLELRRFLGIDPETSVGHVINLKRLLKKVPRFERKRYAEILNAGLRELKRTDENTFIQIEENDYGLDSVQIPEQVKHMHFDEIRESNLEVMEQNQAGGFFYDLSDGKFVNVIGALIFNGIIARLDLDNLSDSDEAMQRIRLFLVDLTDNSEFKDITVEELKSFKNVDSEKRVLYEKYVYQAIEAIVGVYLEAAKLAHENVDWSA